MKAILPGLVMLVMACQPQTSQSGKTFFDLEKLADQLIAENEKSNPSVRKFSKIGEKENEELISDIDWSKELELLRQSDLNKSAYTLSYEEEKSTETITYTLKKGENLPVKRLTIELDENGKPHHIESLQRTKNYLYSSEKDLIVDLKDGNLVNYQIKGWQELFVGGRKEFEVRGEIQK